MYTWNFNMDEAPKGSYKVTVRSLNNKVTETKTFIPEPCHVLLNGKVYQTWKLESGRWNGFCDYQRGDAWFPFPIPPEVPNDGSK